MYLAALVYAEAEPAPRSEDGGVDLFGSGVVEVTARPTRSDSRWDADFDSEAVREALTGPHSLLLEKLTIHFSDLRNYRTPKLRRDALAWMLEDAYPGEADFVVSFAGICEQLDLPRGQVWRSAIEQAVIAELAHRHQRVLRQGHTRLSLELAAIESDLIRDALKRLNRSGRKPLSPALAAPPTHAAPRPLDMPRGAAPEPEILTDEVDWTGEGPWAGALVA